MTAFVLVAWALATFGDDLPLGAARTAGLFVHISAGVAILIVVFARVAWRVTDPPPPLEPRHLETGVMPTSILKPLASSGAPRRRTREHHPGSGRMQRWRTPGFPAQVRVVMPIYLDHVAAQSRKQIEAVRSSRSSQDYCPSWGAPIKLLGRRRKGKRDLFEVEAAASQLLAQAQEPGWLLDDRSPWTWKTKSHALHSRLALGS